MSLLFSCTASNIILPIFWQQCIASPFGPYSYPIPEIPWELGVITTTLYLLPNSTCVCHHLFGWKSIQKYPHLLSNVASDLSFCNHDQMQTASYTRWLSPIMHLFLLRLFTQHATQDVMKLWRLTGLFLGLMGLLKKFPHNHYGRRSERKRHLWLLLVS